MADLNIIGSGGINLGGVGIIYRWTTPTAIVGSGGIEFGGVGVVGSLTPGVLGIIGEGGISFNGEGVIAFTTPPILAVVGSGGIEIGGFGIITFTALPVLSIIGSGGIKFGGQGIIAAVLPEDVPVLSVVGSGGIIFGGTGVIDFLKPPVLAIIGDGGIKLGGFRVPELTVVGFVTPAELVLAVVGSGGIEFGGTGVIAFSVPPIFAAPTLHVSESANIIFGGSGIIAFISPQILQIIGEGGLLLGADPSDDDVFATYVLVGARGEPSIYANFPFNSYAKFRNQYFGAGPLGIYRLEGPDDAGEVIHPGVRIGPMNFGTDREKRLRLLRCGGITTGTQVKVSNGNGSAGYYDVEGGRAGVSREVQGRELTLEITDFETLDHLEIVPLVLHKR